MFGGYICIMLCTEKRAGDFKMRKCNKNSNIPRQKRHKR
uniref:Uncharacterized protein n=1 Tax=Anguilla anguilla TaxID=7936 RepID=A0A0E9SU62_ANGAN